MAKLFYLGRLVDITGAGSEVRDLPDDIVATPALRDWLDGLHGASGALLAGSVRIAINNEIVPEPAAITNTDEIAFMPPVGGG